MTFEFYKNRINQDLLDDLKINRIIIERTKQQAKKYDEMKAEEAGLSDLQLDDFNKIYLSFSSTLDDYVNKLEANTEIFRNAGLVIYRYNLLSNVLNKLDFNFLSKLDKDKLTNQLEDLEPKLEELYRYANINDFTDLKTIGDIVNNFKKKTFQQVKVGDVRLPAIKPIGETTEENLNTIINYLSTLSNTEKELLTKTDISNLEKLSSKAQQIKRDIQKGKSKETDTEQSIKDFEKLYQKISKKLQPPQRPPAPIIEPPQRQKPQPPKRPLPERPITTFTATPNPTVRPAEELQNPLQIGLKKTPKTPKTPKKEQQPAGADLTAEEKIILSGILEADLEEVKRGNLTAPQFKENNNMTVAKAKKFLESYYES